MADTLLQVHLCGADRQPLRERFNFRVEDHTHAHKTLVRVRGWRGPVSIRGLSPTQTYRAYVVAARHRPVSTIFLGDNLGHPLQVFCPVSPGGVTGIRWPDSYPPTLTRVVPQEHVDTLGPLTRACLLNIYTALTRAGLWYPHVASVFAFHQDRIWARVDGGMVERLSSSPQFQPVDGSLHHPPEGSGGGFQRAASFKERAVSFGVLQVTLFHHPHTGQWVADIDIDDAGGMGHVFQVAGHWFTRGATHPYDIHQLLTFYREMFPGYQLLL